MINRYLPPLRISLPAILVFMALLAIGLDFWSSLRAIEKDVESSGLSFVTQEMSLLQGILNNLLRKEDIEGIRSTIANLGSNPNTQAAVLLDEADRILAGSDRQDISKPAITVFPEIEAGILRQVRMTDAGFIRHSRNDDAICGYYPVALASQLADLKHHRTGVFYLRYGLKDSKAQRYYDIRRRLLSAGLFITGTFLVLAVFFHFAVTRRVSRLLSAVQRFSAGEATAKANLAGGDELGTIASAFDRLTETIANKEQALQESHENFQALLNAPHDDILILSRDGLVLAMNESLASRLGFNGGKTTGASYWELIHSDLAQSRQKWLENVLSTRSMAHFEDQWGDRLLYNTVYPVIDSQGEVVRFVIIGQDVTEHRRVEQEREKLQRQLLQAQKMESVGQLAGGVAHDFNNMLGVILGHLDLAFETVEAAHPLFGDLKEIQKAAQRSVDLTGQLLAFARKQTVAPKILRLNETILGMLKMLQRLIGEDIRLSWKPNEKLWPVKIDPSQVDQILANLLVNARDAISGIGSITITTDNVIADQGLFSRLAIPPGEYVLLSVADDGCGMDKEILDHIFEPFFTTKSLGCGTGLGLATLYGIVKQNSGYVFVHSSKGQGTTFQIYLPRAFGDPVQTAPAEREEAPAGSNQTILLVEDEVALLNMAHLILSKMGFRVLTAKSPFDALRVAAQHWQDINLLVTDVILPEMNGQQLANRIRSLKPDIRCLFMSGYTADIITHHGVLEEGVHFISKPFTMKTLRAKVREILT